MNTIDKISAAYRNTAEEARQELNKVQQKIYRIGTLRLLLFVAGAAGIIYFRSESWGILAGIALVTLLPFLSLMKYHNRLFHRKDYLEKKMEINEQELAALDYDTSSFDDGEAYVDPAHLYTYDLDVFGPHSLFQYINRTCTQPGKHRLALWLGKHLERKEEIIRRQEAVGELAPELKFRQRFRILGLLYKGKAADETELCHWASVHLPEPETAAPPAGTGGGNQPHLPRTCHDRNAARKYLRHHLDLLRHRRLRLHRQSHQDAGPLWQKTANPLHLRRPAPPHGKTACASRPAQRDKTTDWRRKTESLPLHQQAEQAHG